MAFYEYVCELCGSRVEEEYAMGKAPKKLSCNNCEGTCFRLYSASVIIAEPVTEARKGRGRG